MIKQIIDENELIQDKLSLDVNGIRVDYYTNATLLRYRFVIRLEDITESDADAAIDEIVEALINQAKNKGQVWNIILRRKNVENVSLFMYQQEVTFEEREDESDIINE